MGQYRVMSGYDLLRQVDASCSRRVRDKEDDGDTDNTPAHRRRLCRLSLPLAKEELKGRVASRRDPFVFRRHGGGRQEASGVAVHSR